MGLYTGLAQVIQTDSVASAKADWDGNKIIPGTMLQVQQIGTLISGATCNIPAMYRFIAGSVSPDNNQSQLAFAPTTNPAGGKWLRADPFFDLVLPISSAVVNAAVLATIPAELTLLPTFQDPFWEMITAWAGGAAPTIGLSYTNQAGGITQGGLLGGAAGDGTFPVRSFYVGTPGSQFTPGIKRIVLNPTATINFDRINDAFTSGTGNAHVPCARIFAPIIPINPS